MFRSFHGCHAPKVFLAGCILLARTYEQSHSETLPAHLGSVLGSHNPEQMVIMTWSESVQLWRVQTDISAMLMETSGLDSHMIRIWLTWRMEMVMRWRLLPCALAGLLSHALNWGCYPRLILRLLPRILLRLMPRNFLEVYQRCLAYRAPSQSSMRRMEPEEKFSNRSSILW